MYQCWIQTDKSQSRSLQGDTMSQIPVEVEAETGMCNRITRDWDLSVWMQHWDLIIFLVPHLNCTSKRNMPNIFFFNVTSTPWRSVKRSPLPFDVIITDIIEQKNNRKHQTGRTRQEK